MRWLRVLALKVKRAFRVQTGIPLKFGAPWGLPSEWQHREVEALLAEAQLVDERTAAMNWSRENVYAFVDLDRVNIEDYAIAQVPRQLAIEHQVLPLRVQGDTLYLALARPFSLRSIDAVSNATGKRIVPVVAVDAALAKALARYFPSEADS